jgi:hypothetical protein
MDLGTIYRDTTRRSVPGAVICFDPFHVIQLANRALDLVFSASRHGADGGVTAPSGGPPALFCAAGSNGSTTANANFSPPSIAPAGGSSGPGNSKKTSGTSTDTSPAPPPADI